MLVHDSDTRHPGVKCFGCVYGKANGEQVTSLTSAKDGVICVFVCGFAMPRILYICESTNACTLDKATSSRYRDQSMAKCANIGYGCYGEYGRPFVAFLHSRLPTCLTVGGPLKFTSHDIFRSPNSKAECCRCILSYTVRLVHGSG